MSAARGLLTRTRHGTLYYTRTLMWNVPLGSHGLAVTVDPWAAALRLSAAVPFFLWLANVAVLH